MPPEKIVTLRMSERDAQILSCFLGRFMDPNSLRTEAICHEFGIDLHRFLRLRSIMFGALAAEKKGEATVADYRT